MNTKFNINLILTTLVISQTRYQIEMSSEKFKTLVLGEGRNWKGNLALGFGDDLTVEIIEERRLEISAREIHPNVPGVLFCDPAPEAEADIKMHFPKCKEMLLSMAPFDRIVIECLPHELYIPPLENDLDDEPLQREEFWKVIDEILSDGGLVDIFGIVGDPAIHEKYYESDLFVCNIADIDHISLKKNISNC